MKRISFFSSLLLAASATGALATPPSTATNGTLYYTTFSGTPNVRKVDFAFDGVSTFAMTNNTTISTIGGADGIIFAPNGKLLVGGQGTGNVYMVDKVSGAETHFFAGVPNAYHLALDPSGNSVYATNIPGALGVVPLSPFSGGVQKILSGSTNSITSIAFDNSGNAYYTDAGPGGTGDVGRIDLTTGITTQVRTGIAAAHGMVFDTYTNKLTLFGSSDITQLNTDPGLTTYSTLDVGSVITGHPFQLDQGSVDGHGHVLVADNNGYLVFADYSNTSQIGNYGFLDAQFLAKSLDDVAPLSGLGSSPPEGTPEPGAMALLIASCGVVSTRVYKKKRDGR